MCFFKSNEIFSLSFETQLLSFNDYFLEFQGMDEHLNQLIIISVNPPSLKDFNEEKVLESFLPKVAKYYFVLEV
jgi:hypothetical protein